MRDQPRLIGPRHSRPPNTRPCPCSPVHLPSRLPLRASSAASPDLPQVRPALRGLRGPRRARAAAGSRGCWATEGPDVAFHWGNQHVEDNVPRGFRRRRLPVEMKQERAFPTRPPSPLPPAEVFAEVSKDLELFGASVADENNLGYTLKAAAAGSPYSTQTICTPAELRGSWLQVRGSVPLPWSRAGCMENKLDFCPFTLGLHWKSGLHS
ncbi:uncharacterized protein [Desmodus rotundus]|uniref:uncharacterized protein isoform X2 n=1 Tax=Desmodus rotundus TaxID=9430 RepID=UPI002381433A|nr:uncharacterized protein LOC112310356 isoform X2 [Desmodus rotundus]